ncbi:GGDEF domain-containing protein [Amphritea sp. HPY]|uniref:GGDEF domain-containing protein n=1 Tax=Amphritea sp. HPY TaxID=3421652 RepID=UPI003D7F0208
MPYADLDQFEHPDYFNFHKQRLLPVFQPLLMFGAAINIIFGISFLFTHPDTGNIALFCMSLGALLILGIHYFVGRIETEKAFTGTVLSLGSASLILTTYFFVITDDRFVFVSFAVFYFLFGLFIIAPLVNFRLTILSFLLVDCIVFSAFFSVGVAPLDFVITFLMYLSGMFVFVGIGIFKVRQNAELSYRLSTDLFKRSVKDDLTQVLNRGAWHDVIKNQLNGLDKRALPLTLMLIDIDYFKDINDSYGHIAGDKILIRVVELLNQHLRKKDCLGRLSGDQFIVFMPMLPLAVAETIAERVRSQVQLTSVSHLGRPIHITCSIGLTSYQRPGTDLARLIQEVDTELCAAKRAGRNRVFAVEY